MTLTQEDFRQAHKLLHEADGDAVLPKDIESLCPACLKVIPGTLYEEHGEVFMRKTCPIHGVQRELISSDATFFRLMIERDRAVTRGVTHPVGGHTASCPQGCGLCREHQAGPIMMNIDLTNRCNLRCPICFANAGTRGEVLELDLDQVRRLLDLACEVDDVQPSCLQFTGGEPTVHPEFLSALEEARQRGFPQVQIATNGLKFAQSREFAMQASEAGLNVAYLQFDGLSDDIYRKTRGRPLLEIKLAAMDNLYAAGIRIVLVPTIVKGINTHQIGAIARFAVENTDRISGVSWQPVAFTGRLNYEERLARRFTVADLAREIQRQSGLVDMYRDWYPYGFVDPFSRFLEATEKKPNVVLGCNPICGAGTYLIVDSQTGAVSPIPAFVDVEGLMQTMQSAAELLNHGGLLSRLTVGRQLGRLKRFYHEENAPAHWSFEQFAEFMMDFADFRDRFSDNEARMKAGVGSRFRSLLMASMHFQDAYNYQLDRVRRCVVHYAAPDGRIYPFCSYNSGPCHRQRVEKEFAIPLAEYQFLARSSAE
jgi:7,8-dihydro-6-hydroxymethylpterin dimethyltransferase